MTHFIDFSVEYQHPDFGSLRILFSILKSGNLRISRVIEAKREGCDVWLRFRKGKYVVGQVYHRGSVSPEVYAMFAESEIVRELMVKEVKAWQKRIAKAVFVASKAPPASTP
jgi:hypothetical protein